MSYIQQNLTDGTVLTAAHVNHVDAGIAANETAALTLSSMLTAIDTMLHPTVYHSITANTTHCTISNAASRVEDGTGYSASLTADAHYALSSVTVTMGGTDITSTAYSNGVVSIQSVTGDVVITATATAIMHQITTAFTHITGSSEATEAADGGAYQTTLTADTGYEITTVTVTMGETDITSTAYSNGVVSIQSVTGDVVITATATAITHQITTAFTHVTGSSQAATAADGSAYQTTLTPDADYEIATVTVTMGATDITSTAYSNGAISIQSVTGDVVITATATLVNNALGSGKLGQMKLGTRNA